MRTTLTHDQSGIHFTLHTRMFNGDHIKHDDKLYIVNNVYLKISADENETEFIGKLDLIEDESEEVTLADIMKLVYGDNFKTSGSNTNEINNNPRLIGLIIAITAFTKQEWLSENSSFVVETTNLVKSKWNNITISWSELNFYDIPSSGIKTKDEICSMLMQLSKRYKISQSIWPIFKS